MGASSRPSNAESALFEEDEDEEGQVKEVKGDEKGSVQRQKSTQKMEINFQDVEETPAGHCIQTVKELHSGTSCPHSPQRRLLIADDGAPLLYSPCDRLCRSDGLPACHQGVRYQSFRLGEKRTRDRSDRAIEQDREAVNELLLRRKGR